jgi:TRAP-type mannitol/chloroaromatic compound transport system permease small subunit
LKLLVPVAFSLLAAQGSSEVFKRIVTLARKNPPATPESPATANQA